MDCEGNPAQCLTLRNRSSSAAATNLPSRTNAADESPWNELRPRIIMIFRVSNPDPHDRQVALAELDRGRRLGAVRQPKIYTEHIATGEIPRKISRHPATAFTTHRLQFPAR